MIVYGTAIAVYVARRRETVRRCGSRALSRPEGERLAGWVRAAPFSRHRSLVPAAGTAGSGSLTVPPHDWGRPGLLWLMWACHVVSCGPSTGVSGMRPHSAQEPS